ncbi:unnamed protein product [Hydatigera taeniaeformis]|uniref:Arrestin_N domain-containing protein n=1 Tax=Hydatigena taeniaeformis TaxID=6205 RepID=A0A0R3WIZ0_HYDTA|nr:unnamed protein product [Hydatigera taeniaeformis]
MVVVAQMLSTARARAHLTLRRLRRRHRRCCSVNPAGGNPMATEDAKVLPSAVTDANIFSIKKKCNRSFGGHPRRRVTANARNRERQAPIEECHLKSRAGFQLPLSDGVSQVTFQYYLGEHQSQIFYGGLTIGHPGTGNINVELGQPIPIDLRENYNEEGLFPLPCLAVPTHIFRRFRVYRITSSASCDLKKLAASLSTDGASPDESDASYPPTGEKLSLLFPSTTPKSGLSLISLRVYYPVQYMQSANELHPIPGSQKTAPLAVRTSPVFMLQQYDEVVAYQSLLTMPVSEFASRVLKGVAGSVRLTNWSSELPTPVKVENYDFKKGTQSSHWKCRLGLLNFLSGNTFNVKRHSLNQFLGDTSVHQNESLTQPPSFLILPVSVYNRFASMRRMLLDGYKSPICPDIGWRVAIPQLATKKGEAGTVIEPPSWDQWTGLETVIAAPSWIISKTQNGEPKSNIRMVFVRRQSDDCGDAISPSLRKSIFGPARIRRTRMKGTNRLVMKVKQLISTIPAIISMNEAKVKHQNDLTSDRDHTTDATSTGITETLNFRYVWSRDYRSNPVRRGTLGPMLSTDIENGRSVLSPLPEGAEDNALTTAPPSSSVTNASTDEEDTRSIGERWHQNRRQQQQQHQHQRPTRSCLPPQRLEVLDRDLERALQRSLADGRNKHSSHAKQELSPPQPSTTAKRRSRQKRTSSSNHISEEQDTHRPLGGALQRQLQNGVKRAKSEVMLEMCLDVAASKPLGPETIANNGSTWANRLRSNSPSATSDSAASNSLRKREKSSVMTKSCPNVDSTGESEEFSCLPGNDAEHQPVPASLKMGMNKGGEAKKKPREAGVVIPKLTLAIEGNGRVRVKSQYRCIHQKHQSAAEVTVAEVRMAESDDPYALPSSPLSNGQETCCPMPGPKKKRRSPSPDPPVLLPEGEVDHVNNSEEDGVGLTLDESFQECGKRSTIRGQPTSQLTSVTSNNFNLGSELSQLPPSLPPIEATATFFGAHDQHSVFPPFSASVVGCSVGPPTFTISLPSSLQQITSVGGQPVFASTQPIVVSSPSLPTPDVTSNLLGAYGNSSLVKPNSATHTVSSHTNVAFWNDCALGRRPATMWTPRNEPLPPPDPPLLARMQAMPSGGDNSGVGLCFFHPSASAVASATGASASSFQSTLLPGIVPIQQHHASATATTTTVAPDITVTVTTPPIHQQALLDASTTGYSMLTSDAATALAMAAAAYFNPPVNSIHTTLHQSSTPGPSTNNSISNQPPVTATVWNNNISSGFL